MLQKGTKQLEILELGLFGVLWKRDDIHGKPCKLLVLENLAKNFYHFTTKTVFF